MDEKESTKNIPPQEQPMPGDEDQLIPEPQIIRDDYKGSDKLKGKVAVITGGDSGIGRAVAIHFAKEGADIAIVYLSEHNDAQKIKEMVEKENRKCLLISGDVGDRDFCIDVIKQVIKEFGKINILVNNAGEQHPVDDFMDLDLDVMEKTFRTNIFSMFYLTQEALKHMKKGDSIINTSSITSYRGQPLLIDYSSTKGAITAFTRALSVHLAEKGIRVNGVAPGPIWTPLIPSTFDIKKVSEFGQDTPMKRAGHPSEVAPAYVFLASEDASYITGQFIHTDGGDFPSS